MKIPLQVKAPFRNYLERIFTPATLSEPNELAEYALSLIEQNEGPNLKQKCMEELTPFLENDNKSIIDRIFLMLEDLDNLPIFEQKLLNELHLLNRQVRSLSPPDREEQTKTHKRHIQDEVAGFHYGYDQQDWVQNEECSYKDRGDMKELDKKYCRESSKLMSYEGRKYDRMGKDTSIMNRQEQVENHHSQHTEFDAYKSRHPKVSHDHHARFSPRLGNGSFSNIPRMTARGSVHSDSGSGGGSKDPQNTVLDIVNIPRYINNIENLNTHFKQFGKIINIETFLDRNSARIRYKTHREAQNAIFSSLPICNNRFVKVFWANNKTEIDHTHSDRGNTELHAPLPAKHAVERRSPKSDGHLSFYTACRPVLPPTLVPSYSYRPARNMAVRYNSPSAPKSNLSERTNHLKGNLAKADMDFQLLARYKVQLKDPSLSEAQRQELEKKCDLLRNQLQTIICTNESILSTVSVKSDSHQEPPTSTFADSFDSPQIDERSTEGTKDIPERSGPIDHQVSASSQKINSWGHLSSGNAQHRENVWTLSSDKSKERDHRMFVIDRRSTAFYLKNIPSELQDLDRLKKHFQQYGQVVDLTLECSQARVQMEDRRSAEKAIIQGTIIDGFPISFEWEAVSKTAEISSQQLEKDDRSNGPSDQ
ncbi:uncharacterized protein LOC126325929 isoform X2 [Schistocerca gregaria]|uniref:uncharacterized protein LOC126325929 isoform X2 n=2 Tax=Schistocerca gregaria TaxID=7010 RepID=UPI00211F3369|nr:uncharacterized protein LOC126325929 isoform X2 [Schistocerca gregaria]